MESMLLGVGSHVHNADSEQAVVKDEKSEGNDGEETGVRKIGARDSNANRAGKGAEIVQEYGHESPAEGTTMMSLPTTRINVKEIEERSIGGDDLSLREFLNDISRPSTAFEGTILRTVGFTYDVNDFEEVGKESMYDVLRRRTRRFSDSEMDRRN